MSFPTCRSLSRLLASCIVVAAVAVPSSPTVAGDPGASVTPTPRALTKAVNQIASTDIPLAAAESTPCTLEKLPGSLAKILPLLPHDHRALIHECAHGRLRLQRSVSTFDLVAAIEAPADKPAAVAAIRGFFDERAVDVVMGEGLSDEPYPISFDWAVVLDPSSGTLFSFVLNCHD